MQKAAEATLRNGYQYFRLEQVQMGQGQMLAGVNTFGSGSMYGNSLGNSFAATAYGSSLSMPVYAPTASVGVTVVMFHARDAGAKEAFSAADVLARLGKSNS
jgi:serine protease inhibitor ecotin